MFILLRGGGERGREREREREKERNIDQLFPTCALTNDRPRYLGTCSYWGSNLQPFGVWEDAPANWTTGPGPSPFSILRRVPSVVLFPIRIGDFFFFLIDTESLQRRVAAASTCRRFSVMVSYTWDTADYISGDARSHTGWGGYHSGRLLQGSDALVSRNRWNGCRYSDKHQLGKYFWG